MATKYRHTHGDFLIEHSMPKPAVHGKMRVKLAPVFDVMSLPQASQQQQQYLQEKIGFLNRDVLIAGVPSRPVIHSSKHPSVSRSGVYS